MNAPAIGDKVFVRFNQWVLKELEVLEVHKHKDRYQVLVQHNIESINSYLWADYSTGLVLVYSEDKTTLFDKLQDKLSRVCQAVYDKHKVINN